MERHHSQRWEEERTKAQYLFAARRRLLDRVGLAEVRGYRMRQLEAEESARTSELALQRTLLPDVEPLAILSIKAR